MPNWLSDSDTFRAEVEQKAVIILLAHNRCSKPPGMRFPVPPDEEQRLACLRSMKLLDTAQEAPFDDVTAWCSHHFNCPMAFISLVDHDRQW